MSLAHIVVKILTSGVSWYFDRQQSGLKTKIATDVGSVGFDQLTC
jgi:hypothetical protein